MTVNSFIPIGYEISIEATYPISEGVSSGLLNFSSLV